MRTPKPVGEFRPSPRVAIREGSVVRFVGSDVAGRIPGTHIVQQILQSGKRVWLEVYGLDKVGGEHVVFVNGRPYDRHGFRWTPFKVRRAR